MRILITGITGFVGSHMADYLLKNVTDVQIIASHRWRSDEANIKHLLFNPKLELVEADLLDRGSIRNLVEIAQPDYVFHFAAQSFPGASFKVPVATLETNIIGTTNLLEELVQSDFDPIVVSVSSSEVYGMPQGGDDMPIKETNSIRAANPYSISKVGHDLMSQYFHKAHGLKVIVTRMFSHEGSRRGKMFAISSFAKQIVEWEMDCKKCGPNGSHIGSPFKIYVGNLDSIRTYSHISDAVHAYWLVATKGTVGEVYNIGGTDTRKVGDVLDVLMDKSNIPKERFEVCVDPGRIRPTDITLQIPDCTKFKEATGWEPTKGVEEITQDLLNYWRHQIGVL